MREGWKYSVAPKGQECPDVSGFECLLSQAQWVCVDQTKSCFLQSVRFALYAGGMHPWQLQGGRRGPHPSHPDKRSPQRRLTLTSTTTNDKRQTTATTSKTCSRLSYRSVFSRLFSCLSALCVFWPRCTRTHPERKRAHTDTNTPHPHATIVYTYEHTNRQWTQTRHCQTDQWHQSTTQSSCRTSYQEQVEVKRRQ